MHCSFCVQPSILRTLKRVLRKKKKFKLHTKILDAQHCRADEGLQGVAFLLMWVLSVLTIVLRESETFRVRLRITYNQYMHHRETETDYRAALCADKRSSLCKRRRVLNMPSPRTPGNWSVDPCGCPRASASLQHIFAAVYVKGWGRCISDCDGCMRFMSCCQTFYTVEVPLNESFEQECLHIRTRNMLHASRDV